MFVNLDADGFHSEANREKMASGQRLADADRTEWLGTVNSAIHNHQYCTSRLLFLASSALKQCYREVLQIGIDGLRFVNSHGERDVLHARLCQRADRFMPATLLDGQLATLEPPAGAIVVNVDRGLTEVIRRRADETSTIAGPTHHLFSNEQGSTC